MAYADTTLFNNMFGNPFGLSSICLERFLKLASRQIDSLTFNRIVRRGFDGLTDFQKELVGEACCMQADFLIRAEQSGNMGDVTSFSVNGVSMNIGNSEQKSRADINNFDETAYMLLEQTGLMWRGVR